MYLLAILTKDRAAGELTIVRDDGTANRFRCLGKSDNASAKAAGNPSRNPLKINGDIPTGEYRAIRVGPGKPLRTFGPGARYALEAVGGQAQRAVREGKRSGLMIHGGATGAPMPPGALRPTRGCLRLDDLTIAALDQLPDMFPVHIRTWNTK